MNTPSYVAIDNISFGFTSINEISENNFKVYPNPSNGIISFEHPLEGGQLSVYNTNGQLMFSSLNNETLKTIDLSFLEQGIYTVVFTNDKRHITKFIKQ